MATVLVREFVCRFGTPLELHSDQRRNFQSKLIKEMCEILGINKTRTTSYHPQYDGMVERYNRTLATQLSMFVNENHSDWDKHLPTVLMAYRTAVHESTGQTPARLMMGHELRVPLDLMFGQPPGSKDKCKSEFAKQLTESLELTHQFARNRLRLSSERMKNQYGGKEILRWQFFTVVKTINDLVYKIQSGPHSKPATVHRNRLRKYVGLHPQSWLKVTAPAERELQVKQHPEIREVIERQPDDRVMPNVEPILEEGTLEQSLLRRSKRQRRPPDRLELMYSNKNC